MMEVHIRLIAIIQNLLRYLLQPFFFLLSKTDVLLPGTKFQKINNSLILLSGTKLADKIRKGEVKSEDAIGAFGFRTRRMNAFLNAVVEDRYVKADEDSYAADQIISSGLKSSDQLAVEKPLLGVPISVSHSCKVQGMQFNNGCLLRQGKKADSNGKAVELLFKSGAIPLIITNAPELCIGAETYNYINGRTSNPYCRQRSVGGGSGGEAAIISSGGSIIGLGTDVAGSLPISAMFTGIFGHKPTPGIVSSDVHYIDSSNENGSIGIGFMTRYSEDIPLVMSILADDRRSILNLETPVSLNELRVLYIEEPCNSFGFPRVSDEIKNLIKTASRYLASNCGCQTQMMRFKEMTNLPEISGSLLMNEKYLPNVLNETDDNNPKVKPNLFIEFCKSFFGLSKHTPGALGFSLMKASNFFIPNSKVKEYIKQGEELKKHIQECLSNDGVLLFPTFPTAAQYHRESFFSTLSYSYSALISSLGLPATHIPMGLNKKGLPIGLMVVAGPNQDRLCFAVAKELEIGFGGWVPPPSM